MLKKLRYIAEAGAKVVGWDDIGIGHNRLFNQMRIGIKYVSLTELKILPHHFIHEIAQINDVER